MKKMVSLNIIWSIVSLLISTLITMLVLPVVTEKLGLEAYGYIALCNNIIVYIDLLASAINVYAIRFISIEYHKGDWRKVNEYYSSVIGANIFIVLLLIVPLGLSVRYIDSILDVSPHLVGDVKILFALTCLNYVVGIVGSVFNVATFASNALYKTNRVKAVSYLLKAVVLIILFTFVTPRVWFVAVASMVMTIYMVGLNFKIKCQLLSEMKMKKYLISARAVMEIARKGIWNSIASLGTILNSGLDLLVTNLYLGATLMGTLAIPKTLSAFITTLLASVVESFRPQILEAYVANDRKRMEDYFIQSMKACGLVTSAIFSVFYVQGKLFLDLWLSEQSTELIFQLVVLTFVSEVFTGVVKPLHYGAVLTGKLRFPCICNLGVGVFNVVAMIALLSYTELSIYAVVLTTIIGNVFYNFGIMPMYVSRILNLSKSSIYGLVVKYTMFCITITLLLKFIMSPVSTHSWLGFCVSVMIATLIVALFYVAIILSKSEQKMFANVLKKCIKRREGGVQ